MTDDVYPLRVTTAQQRDALWDGIRGKPLAKVAELSGEKPVSGLASVFNPGFDAAVKAAGAVPMENLSTADLVSVTSGLLHSLREQPQAESNFGNSTLMRIVWKKHIFSINKAPASEQENIERLAKDIAVFVPRVTKPKPDPAPPRLGIAVRANLRPIQQSVLGLANRYPETQSHDHFVEEFTKALGNVRVSEEKGMFTIELRPSDVPPETRLRNATEFLNHYEGRIHFTSRNLIGVSVTDTDSPLYTLLRGMSTSGKALGE